MLGNKRKAHVEAFDGPMRPSQYNKIGQKA
jgi:hypothetical protein